MIFLFFFLQLFILTHVYVPIHCGVLLFKVNSWNAFSSSVTADDLRTAADSFVSLGLAAVGYEYISEWLFFSSLLLT
jgi:hypothetical protein